MDGISASGDARRAGAYSGPDFMRAGAEPCDAQRELTFFVAITKRNYEQRVADALHQRGQFAYWPRVRLDGRPNHPHTRRRDRNGPRVVPFLPMRVFVRNDGQGLDQITCVNGVEGVERDRGMPLLVPQSLYVAMKARERDGLMVLDPFNVMARLQTVAHPLAGFFLPMRNDARSELLNPLLRQLA